MSEELPAKLPPDITVPVAAPVEVSPEKVTPTITLADVLENIRDPRRWIETEALIELIIANPSLRGILYGYVAEAAFVKYLDNRSITEHFKPDDHKKTKSDRTLKYQGREYTIQLKSLQTNSIREKAPGLFTAKVQNDASDRRRIDLPGGGTIETTCYRAGEYDVLGVSLQPFTGDWQFAFKKNKDLKRSTYRKYPVEVQKILLATLETITYPLTDDWSTDLAALLGDADLGR